ncbi:MAG: hypothetical protein IJB85_11850 [Clostridia bacterium]|nr:hypothetical protein [Clostridia bacterium]
MKKHRHGICLLLSLLCALLPLFSLRAACADIRISVSPSADARIWEGWGSSLCWWANRLGYCDTLAQQAADLFFGSDGLRMNIMRYNIGGGDDPSHVHITRTDSAVPGWLVHDAASQSYTYDFNADGRQLNVLRRSVCAAGENALVEVFSNSPPYFMTVSGCSSGALNASDNNLRSDCREAFADYLAQVTAYIQYDLGIPVHSLSPMNEPDTDYWQALSPKQEGCHIDPGEDQSLLILAVRQALDRHHLDHVILAASDETSPQKQIAEYKAYSDAAKKSLGRINTHTYSEKGLASLGRLSRQEGFSLWMSEVDGSGTAGRGAGEMGAALWMGQKIISDIRGLSPSAWVMWQVIDNHISSEGFAGNRDFGMVDPNQGYWGVAVADHDNQTILLTQKYYGLGQFTRYIRPGSILIPCGKDALAAYSPDRSELVIVVLNTSGREQAFRADLSAFSLSSLSVEAVRTSGSMQDGEHWTLLPAIPLNGSALSASLPANSITTFILADVHPFSVP